MIRVQCAGDCLLFNERNVSGIVFDSECSRLDIECGGKSYSMKICEIRSVEILKNGKTNADLSPAASDDLRLDEWAVFAAGALLEHAENGFSPENGKSPAAR